MGPRDLWYRISKLFGRGRAEDGLDTELRFHLEKQTEKYAQLGMDPVEARRRARIEFGQLAQIKEETREAWGTRFVESLWRDAGYALRGFRKSPFFTIAIVLTLAVGIGANTAVFSVVSAVLIRPLPYDDPKELTVLWTNFGPDNPQNFISGPEYAEMLEFSDLFEDISVVTSTATMITGSGEPEYVTSAVASGNFFDLLGTQAAQGRLIDPADDAPGSLVAVISDGLWRRRFGADPAIIGADILPLGGNSFSGTTWASEATGFEPDDALTEATQTYVSPGYFRAMGIRMVSGRGFSDADSRGARRVAVVDEDFARLFWPDEDPLGKEIGIDPVDADLTWSEVVGVAVHVRPGALSEPGRPQVYFPYSQWRSLQTFGAGMFVALRTGSEPSAIVSAARDAVWELDADQPVDNVATMDARVSGSLASERFSMLLLSGFAGVALVLAIVGVYGVASYSVNRRNQEIGVRMALGAAAGNVRTMILKQNLWMVAVGVGVGILVSLGLSRLVTNMLFAVAPHDPTTCVAASALVLSAAALGCWLPAIRATRVDPLVALRQE